VTHSVRSMRRIDTECAVGSDLANASFQETASCADCWFGVLATIIASPGLTPRRVSTFLLFTPWFLLYGVAMSFFTARQRNVT
jgi:hypothetical protein